MEERSVMLPSIVEEKVESRAEVLCLTEDQVIIFAIQEGLNQF